MFFLTYCQILLFHICLLFTEWFQNKIQLKHQLEMWSIRHCTVSTLFTVPNHVTLISNTKSVTLRLHYRINVFSLPNVSWHLWSRKQHSYAVVSQIEGKIKRRGATPPATRRPCPAGGQNRLLLSFTANLPPFLVIFYKIRTWAFPATRGKTSFRPLLMASAKLQGRVSTPSNSRLLPNWPVFGLQTSSNSNSAKICSLIYMKVLAKSVFRL